MAISDKQVPCSQCGTSTDYGALFCGSCGTAMQYFDADDTGRFVGARIADRYEIVERIARGGMGEVYRAQQIALKQPVAVKFLHRRFAESEEFARRFFNEVKIAGSVRHPNAVSMMDCGRLDDGTLYFVMEYVDGIALARLVRRRTQLPPQVALRIAIQVAEVLAEAHSLNIIHRDVKPDNIMIVEGSGHRYSAKVLDFGIAKIVGEEGENITQTGVMFGTPEYMSPEQAAGQPIDHRADVYALGLVLYYMLAGQPPFRDKNKLALLQRQIREAPQPLRRVSGSRTTPEIADLVHSCLEKDPARRPQSMAEFLSRAEALVTSETSSNAALEAIIHSTKAGARTPTASPVLSRDEQSSAPVVMTSQSAFPQMDPDRNNTPADLRVSTAAFAGNLNEPLSEPLNASLSRDVGSRDLGDLHSGGFEKAVASELLEGHDDVHDDDLDFLPARKGRAAWFGLAAVLLAAVAVGLLFGLPLLKGDSGPEGTDNGVAANVDEGPAVEAEIERALAALDAGDVATASAIADDIEAQITDETRALFDGLAQSIAAAEAAATELAAALSAGRCRDAHTLVESRRGVLSDALIRTLSSRLATCVPAPDAAVAMAAATQRSASRPAGRDSGREADAPRPEAERPATAAADREARRAAPAPEAGAAEDANDDSEAAEAPRNAEADAADTPERRAPPADSADNADDETQRPSSPRRDEPARTPAPTNVLPPATL